jgi:succinoglycan biosynthesis protein ExoM
VAPNDEQNVRHPNGPPITPRVSICLATFRRNERLRAVLDDLVHQDRLPDQVVVVDNDPAGGARVVVEECRAAGPPFRIDYDIQPEPNIALTRNRTFELASGDWMAFIDDDERAPKEWLGNLLHAAEIFGADGVLAPVEPQVPPSAPAWIRRGRFYDFPHQPEGARVPYDGMRFGNVLLRGACLRAEPGPFDPSHGLMTGEDFDLLARLTHKGAKLVWSEKAPVFEPIEAKRLSLRWLLQRALSGGQAFARYAVSGGFKPIGSLGRFVFFVRALLQMLLAACIAAVSWLFGRHYAVAWLIKAVANFGKLTVLWGWRYREYARPSGSSIEHNPHKA